MNGTVYPFSVYIVISLLGKIYLIVFSVWYNTIQKLINSALFFSRSAGVCMHVGLSTAMLITIILSLQELLLRPEGILLI